MKFHKEGYPTLIITLIVIAAITALTHFVVNNLYVNILGYALSSFLLITILQFFRNPLRQLVRDDNKIIAPADGKVVVIEEVMEPEYFKDKRIQVSIFMSPINVHINRMPISGVVKYVKYHAGLYLVAWHPKSSTENERSSIVVQHKNQKEILFRQIAGALARRIVYYVKENETATQGNEFGFIKFGSRVDLFLPIGTKINVKIGDITTGGVSVIGEF